ncbi:hypothetical protein [Halothermothrix orenii]|uniref:Uncharacterized protein n=1 Tax=Halothermothrix orenii (strain H 168 / OCM 544 / DSM 9562) TaxID=373903 RepID=B8CX92_HALOH|nr:hypothetical protein [Halothermothrix orenii]ACL69911.1 hypothetical protein Hore_11590 [Halothermothrix orenii H 168]
MFKRFFSIFLVGLVIKIMDDYLDIDIDNLKEEINIVRVLDRGVLPYSLIIIVIALALNFKEAATYFLASYTVGMAKINNYVLPSKLKSWQESIFVFILSVIFFSWLQTLSAIILITGLQIVDDFIDYRYDKYKEKNNILDVMGFPTATAFFMILLIISLKFFPVKLIYFVIASTTLYLLFWQLYKLYSHNLKMS